ncbi:hypothetical protein, partial [Methanocorpusculum sp. GPch4]|uniref:hypothetical protein n=1 Tax=Methanocorpusculum sp. GPch4 TaxID=2527877 RepID=UPI001ADDF769
GGSVTDNNSRPSHFAISSQKYPSDKSSMMVATAYNEQGYSDFVCSRDIINMSRGVEAEFT